VDEGVSLDQAAVRARLGTSCVGIVGLGGLGSNAAMMLVRSGVGRLVLADFDRVEGGNLNRQLYFGDQLGRLKVEALSETLRRIEPDVELTLVAEPISSDNIAHVFAGVDVLLEAVDAAEGKAAIVAAASDLLPGTPLVWAMGLAGCGSANEIRTQCVGECSWLVGDLEADVRDGLPLLASRVMVAAAQEAHAVIRLLLGMTAA
jgi:sulfur carrier protein ThiS adenylyltransferase